MVTVANARRSFPNPRRTCTHVHAPIRLARVFQSVEQLGGRVMRAKKSSTRKTKLAATRRAATRRSVRRKLRPPAKKPRPARKPVVRKRVFAKLKPRSARRKPAARKGISRKIATPIGVTPKAVFVRYTPVMATHATVSGESSPVTAERTDTTPSPKPIRLQVPTFLLEGDHPSAPALSGPGKKFALGPAGGEPHFTEPAGELSPSYGTGRLHVIARDPHWLYASWDFHRQQQLQFNTQSAHRHLVLRISAGETAARPVAEVHVHPESRHWFVHVEQDGARYTVQLGYYDQARRWTRVAESGPVQTPRKKFSNEGAIRFATIPFETPLEELVSAAGELIPESLPEGRSADAPAVSLQKPELLAMLREAGNYQALNLSSAELVLGGI